MMRRWLWMILSIGLGTALLTGCEDNPFDLGLGDTHPDGLVIREAGRDLIVVDRDGRVSGSLEVVAGGRSGRLEIIFQDARGSRIVPADSEYLEVTVSFPDRAEFEHDSPGSFSGRIHGLSAGRTDLIFKYREDLGGTDRGIWNSPAIELMVTP